MNETSARILTQRMADNAPVALLCHAPAAVLAAQDAPGGSPFAGRKMTGFSNDEERAGGLAEKAPWLLEDRLVALGAEYEQAPEPWASYVIVDGNPKPGRTRPRCASPRNAWSKISTKRHLGPAWTWPATAVAIARSSQGIPTVVNTTRRAGSSATSPHTTSAIVTTSVHASAPSPPRSPHRRLPCVQPHILHNHLRAPQQARSHQDAIAYR